MSDHNYVDQLKRTNNGREIAARETTADVIATCQNDNYRMETAIWAALTLLGELVINTAVLADAVETDNGRQ